MEKFQGRTGCCYLIRSGLEGLGNRRLLLPDKNVDGRAGKVPAFANLVLQEAAVGVFHILREVGIKHE